MKNLDYLKVFFLIAIAISCKHPKTIFQEIPQNFEVSAVKKTSIPDSLFRLFLFPFEVSPRAAIYPKLKGIPDSLRNIKKYIFSLDDVQAIFQAYKSGFITKDVILNSLRRNINDTLFCTPGYVKTFVIIVVGVSKTGQKYYLVDSNNNYDLSDESLFKMPEKISQNQLHKVLYEKYAKNKIELDSTWIVLHDYKNTDGIWVKFCESTSSSFTFDSVQYNLIAYPAYGIGVKYTENAFFEITDSSHKDKQVFEYNQYAHLSDLYYKVSCSSDGRTISFDLDTNALDKGSTQINMPAIPFKTNTLKDDTIEFPQDYKGKYVLLDFWSTSCPHCIDDIRNVYMALYKKYAGDKFEIIGIADDSKNKVERFVSQNRIPWTMIPAPKSFIQQLYKIDVYPALFLIDPNGIVISKGQDLRKDKINSVLEGYLERK
jgi:peroxiredoxin